MNSDLMKWASVLKIALKVIPMLMALFCLLSSILAYFNFNVVWINYIAGISVLPITFLYIASYAFKFCAYHRMFLNYIITDNIICFIDTYFTIPISDLQLLQLLITVAGVYLFVIIKMKFFS